MRVKAVETDTLTKYNKVLKPYEEQKIDETVNLKPFLLTKDFLLKLEKSYVIKPRMTYVDMEKLFMSKDKAYKKG